MIASAPRRRRTSGMRATASSSERPMNGSAVSSSGIMRVASWALRLLRLRACIHVAPDSSFVRPFLDFIRPHPAQLEQLLLGEDHLGSRGRSELEVLAEEDRLLGAD